MISKVSCCNSHQGLSDPLESIPSVESCRLRQPHVVHGVEPQAVHPVLFNASPARLEAREANHARASERPRNWGLLEVVLHIGLVKGKALPPRPETAQHVGACAVSNPSGLTLLPDRARILLALEIDSSTVVGACDAAIDEISLWHGAANALHVHARHKSAAKAVPIPQNVHL